MEEELREQAQALRASAEAYDSGTLWEAKRLAATTYILLHDNGRNCKSLLGQLGLKGPMFSTANHANDAPLPLAVITMKFGKGEKGMSFTPRLDEHSSERRLMSFSRWYEERIFANARMHLSRKNLIRAFRSQAGGAHVDEKITDEAFQWLRTDSPIKVFSGPPGPARDAQGNEVACPAELDDIFPDLNGPVPNGHYASMRQIAWEVDQKLREFGY